MKPVNLLPEGQRPLRPTDSAAGGAYVVVGVLGALLVLVLVYVLVANGVESRKQDIAQARQQTQAADARAAALAPFGNFADVAQTRNQSVSTLASSRFDWERLVRELALVLPSGAWLTDVDAGVLPDASSGSSPASGTPAGAGTAATAPTGPSAHISGCAKHQPDVAEVMVRLRKMHRVSDVSLEESSEAQADGGSSSSSSSSSSTAGPPSSGSSASGAAGCGSAYDFKLTVSFDPQPDAATQTGGNGRLPVRLGGGQ